MEAEQNEISLDTGHAYLKDKVKELKNQLPNGDPFVFIGAFALVESLGQLIPGRSVSTVTTAASAVPYCPDMAVKSASSEVLQMMGYTEGTDAIVNSFKNCLLHKLNCRKFVGLNS